MKKAYLYPGSFDPITNGHLDLIKRAAKLCDVLYIVIGLNDQKNYLFSVEERKQMIIEATKGLANIIVEASDKLIVDYAKEKHISVIVRGFRNTIDFEDEQEMYFFNNKIEPSIETIVLFSKIENFYTSSSNIKELLKFKADVTSYVPQIVIDTFNKKSK
ncbi:MAG: pantetheine-phosphate adenylyltransferase [Acholeplasmatales bacterium]|nr:pantetheine-phosphate adenylyltransferase [Acholeplasmatales bacterium]